MNINYYYSWPQIFLLLTIGFSFHFLVFKFLGKKKVTEQAVVHETFTYILLLVSGIFSASQEYSTWGAIGSSFVFLPLISYVASFYIFALIFYSLPRDVVIHHLFYIGVYCVFSLLKLNYYLMVFPLLISLMESVVIFDSISYLLRKNKNLNITIYAFSLSYKGIVLCLCLILSGITLLKLETSSFVLTSLLIFGNGIHFFFWVDAMLRSRRRIESLLKLSN